MQPVADEPELTVNAILEPVSCAIVFSNILLNLPVVNQPSSDDSIINFISSKSITLPLTVLRFSWEKF